MKNSLHSATQFFPLEVKHIHDLVTLEQACFSTPWGQEQYKAAFAQKSFVAFGLRLIDENESVEQGPMASPCGEGGELSAPLVAYISLYHTLDEMEILNIAVSVQHRRCGYGEKILSAALQKAQTLGVVRILLEVRVGNVPARALYEKAGFVPVGLRKKYYADTGEDACIYELALS